MIRSLGGPAPGSRDRRRRDDRRRDRRRVAPRRLPHRTSSIASSAISRMPAMSVVRRPSMADSCSVSTAALRGRRRTARQDRARRGRPPSRARFSGGHEPVGSAGEVGIPDVQPLAELVGDAADVTVEPAPVPLVLGGVGPDRVRGAIDVRLERERHVCRAAASAPSRTRSRTSAGSATQPTSPAAVAPARRPARSSTGCRRSSGGRSGSGGPGRCSPVGCSSARGRARSARPAAHRAGLSRRSASSPRSASSVVCRSSSTSPVRRRVAATTGSTARSSRGSTSWSHSSRGTASSKSEDAGVVPHRDRLVGPQVEPEDDPGEAGTGAAGRPVTDPGSRLRCSAQRRLRP